MDRHGIELLEGVDKRRESASRIPTPESRSNLGQFFTPAKVARFMAELSQPHCDAIRLLDPGAGVGSLTAAWVEHILSCSSRPRSISVTAIELDERLHGPLQGTLDACAAACRNSDVKFDAEIVLGDFVSEAVEILSERPLMEIPGRRFDCVIMNPPYRKINSDSATRRRLRRVGIETSNFYSAFAWLAMRLLDKNGELIAITPRSFCNGPYFRPFRLALTQSMEFSRIHVFESRTAAFKGDDVLQENIVFRATKTRGLTEEVTISQSQSPTDLGLVSAEVPARDVVSPDDPDRVIHIVPDALGKRVARRIRSFRNSLADLRIEVSTGRVVDFRVRDWLVASEIESSNDMELAPLIYPTHLEEGAIVWPKRGKKPNFLKVNEETRSLLVSRGNYVLVKRFSAKEERRRLTAAVCRGDNFEVGGLAFENHLNFFHRQGNGLGEHLASGLAAYLNSSLVDAYFRQFSGHTQVNAADLRSLPYPSLESLQALGMRIGSAVAEDNLVDEVLDEILTSLPREAENLHAKQAHR